MPLVIGGPYQGGYFANTSFEVFASGTLTDAPHAIATIPSITLGIGGTHDMLQYVTGNITDSQVLGLTPIATYSHATGLLTGVSVGSLTGLQLEITF